MLGFDPWRTATGVGTRLAEADRCRHPRSRARGRGRPCFTERASQHAQPRTSDRRHLCAGRPRRSPRAPRAGRKCSSGSVPHRAFADQRRASPSHHELIARHRRGTLARARPHRAQASTSEDLCGASLRSPSRPRDSLQRRQIRRGRPGLCRLISGQRPSELLARRGLS